jgi:hypothetical protein
MKKISEYTDSQLIAWLEVNKNDVLFTMEVKEELDKRGVKYDDSFVPHNDPTNTSNLLLFLILLFIIWITSGIWGSSFF